MRAGGTATRALAASIGALAFLTGACSTTDDGRDANQRFDPDAAPPARDRTDPAGRSTAAALQPPAIPAEGAYLGAWVNPDGARGADAVRAQLDQLPSLGAEGDRMGILHLFTSWESPAPVEALADISSTGAIPLLSWACGRDEQIAGGHEDERIRAYAAALRDYGQPVFLRYAWEMNLDLARSRRCAGPEGPAGFVAAWRRVVGIFRDVGARNVAFVWCPSTDAGNWRAYYPGADIVDWIGVDGYVRSADPAAATSAFDRVFGAFYDDYAGEGRPIMVAETGALPGAQGPYLASLTTVIPQRFPLVRALAYFDAPGPRGAWSLDGDGRRAFAALARSAHFSFHG